MTNDTGWPQSVLTTRWICSRHLVKNFERLAAAISWLELPDTQPVLDYLEAAIATLAAMFEAAWAIRYLEAVVFPATVPRP
jgi:hypothetical protein